MRVWSSGEFVWCLFKICGFCFGFDFGLFTVGVVCFDAGLWFRWFTPSLLFWWWACGFWVCWIRFCLILVFWLNISWLWRLFCVDFGIWPCFLFLCCTCVCCFCLILVLCGLWWLGFLGEFDDDWVGIRQKFSEIWRFWRIFCLGWAFRYLLILWFWFCFLPAQL